jgi:hypothetical protein
MIIVVESRQNDKGFLFYALKRKLREFILLVSSRPPGTLMFITGSIYLSSETVTTIIASSHIMAWLQLLLFITFPS